MNKQKQYKWRKRLVCKFKQWAAVRNSTVGENVTSVEISINYTVVAFLLNKWKLRKYVLTCKS